MVAAILFDLFETLITESETRPPRASAIGSRLGLDPVAFREKWKRRRLAVTLGRLSFRDAIAEVGVALGSPVSSTDLDRLCRDRADAKSRAFALINTQVVAMLDELLHRGQRVGVISNCFAEDVEAWPRSPLAARVHARVFSFEVGLAKPDPAIYLETLRLMGVSDGGAVFIGDGSHDELAGARQAGLRSFRALWFLERGPGGQGEEILRTPEDVLDVTA